MASLDEVFGLLQSKIKAEKKGHLSFITLQNVKDPKFNAKAVYPDSINSRKVASKTGESPSLVVCFKTPAAAEEASKKKVDGVEDISLGKEKRGKLKPEKKTKNFVRAPVAEGVKNFHGWKSYKDVKILVRRHMKSLKEQKAMVIDKEAPRTAYEREISFLQKVMQFIQSGKPDLKQQTEYFENYEAGNEVQFIKKARVSLETQIQLRINDMRTTIVENRRNPRKQIAIEKLKKSYYRSITLIHHLRGEKVPKIPKDAEIEVKDEPTSDEEAPAEKIKKVEGKKSKSKGPAKKTRYFQL